MRINDWDILFMGRSFTTRVFSRNRTVTPVVYDHNNKPELGVGLLYDDTKAG